MHVHPSASVHRKRMRETVAACLPTDGDDAGGRVTMCPKEFCDPAAAPGQRCTFRFLTFNLANRYLEEIDGADPDVVFVSFPDQYLESVVKWVRRVAWISPASARPFAVRQVVLTFGDVATIVAEVRALIEEVAARHSGDMQTVLIYDDSRFPSDARTIFGLLTDVTVAGVRVPNPKKSFLGQSVAEPGGLRFGFMGAHFPITQLATRFGFSVERLPVRSCGIRSTVQSWEAWEDHIDYVGDYEEGGDDDDGDDDNDSDDDDDGDDDAGESVGCGSKAFQKVLKVLHAADSVVPGSDEDLFLEPCLQRLCRIVAATGAKIVLSSSWRLEEEALAEVRRQLERVGLELYDTTRRDSSFGYASRAEEILDWLREAEAVETCVVLDDLDLRLVGDGKRRPEVLYLPTFWFAAGGSAQVWSDSGDEVFATPTGELKDVAELKQSLRTLHGFPLCLQQLAYEGRSLDDSAQLDKPMDLHLTLASVPDDLNPSQKAEIASELVGYAARQSSAEVAARMLKGGVDKDLYDASSGSTALLAASGSNHIELVSLLLSSRASTELQDRGGNTALMLASGHGYDQVARLLVKAGAHKDLHGRAGDVSIIRACERRHLEVLLVLLKAGVSCDACDPETGNSALFIASYRGHSDIASVLLGAHADSDFQDPQGKTPLLVAAERGNLQAARVLLDAYAEADSCDNHGNTALILASDNGHIETVRLLMQRGADKEIRNQAGHDALTSAAMRGHVQIVRLLLTLRQIVGRRDYRDSTAMHAIDSSCCVVVDGKEGLRDVDVEAAVQALTGAGQVAALLAEGQPRDESSAWRLRWEAMESKSLGLQAQETAEEKEEAKGVQGEETLRWRLYKMEKAARQCTAWTELQADRLPSGALAGERHVKMTRPDWLCQATGVVDCRPLPCDC
ncbi:Kidins220 [Symbiodinium sp. KB8]|nr:Kidins220 [Symbiodinium sp. KB8]